MAHQDRGASSLVWIRREITRNFYSSTPITTILEITVKIVINDVEEVKEQPSITRIRIYEMISDELHNRTIVINRHPINLHFREKDRRKVHHISSDPHLDVVKALFMKAYINDVNGRLIALYPHHTISVNFILTRPLEYVPDYNPLIGSQDDSDEDEENGSLIDEDE